MVGQSGMYNKRNLDKITYIMLGIPNSIATLLLLTVVGVGGYYIFEGLGDSNAGGWLIFIVLVFGIWLTPCIILWIIQIIFYIIGLIKNCHNNVRGSRKLGLVNAIFSVVSGVMFWLIASVIMTDMKMEFLIMTAITMVVVAYCILTLVFCSINFKR